jgi:carboxypeptidase D
MNPIPDQTKTKLFVVEHLDPELEEWSALEYKAIAIECRNAGAAFCLSFIPASLNIPTDLRSTQGFQSDTRSVETLFSDTKDQVCLLDPRAATELSPEDGDRFQVFVFGGILGR